MEMFSIGDPGRNTNALNFFLIFFLRLSTPRDGSESTGHPRQTLGRSLRPVFYRTAVKR